MLLTTGIVALSRKVADEKAKKREARQGHLNIGDSEVAKQAFESPIKRAGTEIVYEDPQDIAGNSPATASPSPSTPQTDVQDTRQTAQLTVQSPVKSEKALLGPEPTSPYSDTPTAPSEQLDRSASTRTQPPPYSPEAQSAKSNPLSSVYSRDVDGNTLAASDTQSISTRSTNSNGTHAIRVKTIGSDLKSGFPYHPGLFELRVHPEKWTAFTTQVIESTKFSMNDHAKIWGAATATALTGAIGTSIYLGRSMKRSAEEKKVKAGLTDISDGGLGDTLKAWNETYFSPRGLFVHLELSESAMKNPGQRSKTFRKSAIMYSKREDRERKREERKFVIVITQLNEDGQPIEALHELDVGEEEPAELENPEEPSSAIAELPGDAPQSPVELPAPESSDSKKPIEPPGGYIEMDSDNGMLLEKLHLEGETGDILTDSEDEMTPAPLKPKFEI